MGLCVYKWRIFVIYKLFLDIPFYSYQNEFILSRVYN
jgi:hypothetical protein